MVSAAIAGKRGRILAEAPQSDAEYIRDRVRAGDQDRYWAALLAPEPVRADLLALYAFHLEIAQIPELVSEPQLGEIRMEWWREALSTALAGGGSDHPVLKPLAAAAAAHTLSPVLLEGMIAARSFDLAREPMPDFASLHNYLRATAGAVFRLGAQIAGVPDGAREASNHAALAYGLTGLMRALPYHATKGQIFLPAELLAKHGLHPQILLDGNDNQDLRAALRDLRQQASDALEAARLALHALPRSALAPFLPLALVPPYLKALGVPGHHPLRDVAQINPLMRYGLIWRGHLRGRV
jgi:phytoene synthase